MKNSIILHHSVGRSSDQYQGVFDYHNNGAGGKWPRGYGIQYAWFIEKSGTVKQGGAESATLWQAGTYYWNTRSIGICLAGDFRYEPPTQEQILALAKLVTDIQNRWGIPDDRIFLHREVRKTECPATDLRALLFTEREKMLRMNIVKLTNALKHVTGPRRTLIERILARL